MLPIVDLAGHPCSVPCCQRSKEASSKRPLRRLECFRHRVDNLRAGENVSLGCIARSGPPACPGMATAAGEGGSTAASIDDAYLPELTIGIIGQELLKRFLCGDTSRHEVETTRAIGDVSIGLGRYGTSPGPCPRNNCADGKEFGRYRNAKLAVREIHRDDRKGRGYIISLPSSAS